MSLRNRWKSLRKGNVAEICIAFLTALTFVVLLWNLNKLDKQILEMQKQYLLAQTLNQPLCAVKELKVDSVRANVVQISPIIKNFGKMEERSASFAWRVHIIKDIRNNKPKELGEPLYSALRSRIRILPDQEISAGFIQYNIRDFNKFVKGDESALLVYATVEYHDPKGGPQRYSCSYMITRLADLKKNKYEVTLNSAE